MEKDIFDERASRLEEVGKVINKLPGEIRLDAFNLLKAYVTKQGMTGVKEANGVEDGADGADTDAGAASDSLFAKHIHEQPSDNVRLIAAHLFQLYGSEPFSLDEVEAIAASAGITIPNRVNMTLRAATENGNKLFTSAGRGKFRPTVHGELFLKNTYKVKKGTKTRPKGNA